jgi:glycosyltransferase involved in cell wall biosynthesis
MESFEAKTDYSSQAKAGKDGKIYFDLTSALRYILENDNITGIQRVEINIVLGIGSHMPNVHICYFDEKIKKHRACPITEITRGQPCSKELILSRFGSLESGIFPRSRSLKTVLNRSGKKGFSRSLLKLYIYWLSIFRREKYYDYFPITKINLEIVDEFSERDIMYLIGNMITTPELTETAHALKRKGGTVVQTVHDVIPLTRPELVPSELSEKFTRWIDLLPSYATHLVSVSNYTKDQVEKIFKNDTFKSISAIPLAHEFIGAPRVLTSTYSTARHQSSSLPNERFVLCVGTIEVRKNGFNLLQAWKKVMLQLGHRTPRLVFAGRIGWHLEAFKELLESDPSLQAAIQIVSKPTDEQLSALYRDCLFTVFPSQYEGWGLPIGESLWFGKACIASDSTSMPEVGGDLVSYVNPHDVDQLASKMIELLSDETVITAWENKIVSSPLRSWSDVSRDIAEFISNIT